MEKKMFFVTAKAPMRGIEIFAVLAESLEKAIEMVKAEGFPSIEEASQSSRKILIQKEEAEQPESITLPGME